MGLNKTRVWWCLAYIVTLFVGFSFPVLSFLFAVILLALLLDQEHSLVRRVLLSWFAYFGLLIVSYLSLHSFHLSLGFKIYALVLPLLPITLVITGKRTPKIGRIATKFDIAALSLSGLTFFMLLLPMKSTSMPQFLLFLSSGEDNASHFGLFHYTYQHQDYAYLVDNTKTGLIDSLSIYQQGLHINESFFARSTLGTNPSEKALLTSFYLQSAAYYALFIFYTAYLLLLVAKNLYKKSEKTLVYVYYGFLPLLTLLIGMGIFLQLMGWGFQTQIASYVLLLIIIYLLMLPPVKKRSPEAILLMALMVCSLANVWYFLLPIAGVAILSVIDVVPNLVKKVKVSLPVICLTAFALIPIIINSLLSTKKNALNEPGGVYIPSTLSTVLLYISAATLWIVSFKFTKLKQYRPTLIYPAVAAVLFCLAVWLFQTITIGHNEYYYYKSIYTALVLVFILLFGAGIAVISYYAERNRFVTTNLKLLAAGLFLGLTCFIFILKPVYPRVYMNNWFNHSMELSDAAVLLDTQKRGMLNDIVYVGDCKVASDYISNRWAGAIFLSEDVYRSSFETSRIIGQPDKEAILLKDYLRKNPKALIRSSGNCLNADVGATVLHSKNTVVYDK